MSEPKQKPAATQYRVLDEIRDRWSPYRFDRREVETSELLQCFEAARWAASSYNEQPWSFIVANRSNSEAFEKMLGVLLEANQAWAKDCGTLVLTVSKKNFSMNDKPNRVAQHDVGQAAAHFALQATSLGLAVHQMAGVELDKAREAYGIPESHEVQTAWGVGYAAPPTDDVADELAKRDAGERGRKSFSEFIFESKWQQPASWIS